MRCVRISAVQDTACGARNAFGDAGVIGTPDLHLRALLLGVPAVLGELQMGELGAGGSVLAAGRVKDLFQRTGLLSGQSGNARLARGSCFLQCNDRLRVERQSLTGELVDDPRHRGQSCRIHLVGQ